MLLYLESFGNPRAFARIARRVARRKPILAMKSGTTRAGATRRESHTAALAGSDVAVDALFRQAGVLRARHARRARRRRRPPLVQPLPQGRRVARGHQRGRARDPLRRRLRGGRARAPRAGERPRALAERLPAEASLANPVDMLGSATAATYEAVLPPLLADPGSMR